MQLARRGTADALTADKTDSNITVYGLNQLASLNNLRDLTLSSTLLRDPAMLKLAQLKSLEILDLNGTRVATPV